MAGSAADRLRPGTAPVLFLGAGLAVGLASDAWAQRAGSGPERDPADADRQLYQAACATCHGSDGRGADSSRLGFDTPLPDFTDCSFATREPDADWHRIAHEGGPTRAFDRMMPAFGDALTDAQLQQALDHVRTFCADEGWPRGELNLPRALLTEKAYPEDEAMLVTEAALEGSPAVSGKLILEKRLGARSQVELVVPYGARELATGELGAAGTGRWAEGMGDVGVGLKHALLHSLSSGNILSIAGEVFLPTGDEGDGYGKGTFVFEPFVAFGQILPVGFLQLQGGVELPVDESRAESEAFARLALGESFTPGRLGSTWTPLFELQAAAELGDERRINWDYVPQLQVTLSKRQHIMFNAGVRMPMNDLHHRPLSVLCYLLWDWFDGGLDEGW